jgi:hypothetical protein
MFKTEFFETMPVEYDSKILKGAKKPKPYPIPGSTIIISE